MDCDSLPALLLASKILVVTLVHFYCGLRHCYNLSTHNPFVHRSNPCPFLLWIATLNVLNVNVHRFGSNPCPFLLWIATPTSYTPANFGRSGSNPCPFLLWIATSKLKSSFNIDIVSSNPCPFLLWIATCTPHLAQWVFLSVVTLVHFYCGLRQCQLFAR